MASSTDRAATSDEVRRNRIEKVAENVTTGEQVLRLNVSLRRLLGVFDLATFPDVADGLCEEDVTSVHLWTGRMMDVISAATDRGEWVW
jgi:hypothetical protein